MWSPSDLSQRLAARVLDVCQTYLDAGHREGRYWLVGDVHNTPGRSMFVRLAGPLQGRGAVGKWSDAATGEHGDLLDLIRLNRGLTRFADVRDEVRAFLALPPITRFPLLPAPRSSPLAAQRLFAAGRPVPGTLAEVYLRARGISCALDWSALRFHPACYYVDPAGQRSSWPALLAAATDLSGTITGVLRTYLAPTGLTKAPVNNPRRAMGDMLGSGLRLGAVDDNVAIGEGLETMLAVKSLRPDLPVIAATSASHLAALRWPSSVRQLFIAHDNDIAGRMAAERIILRILDTDLDVALLTPPAKDWNAVIMSERAAARGLRA